MARRKRKKNTVIAEKNKGTMLPAFVLLFVLVAAALAYVLISGRTQTPAHTGKSTPSTDFLIDGEVLIEKVVRLHTQEYLGLDAVNQRLPATHNALIMGEDINATNAPNYLLSYHGTKRPKLDKRLSDAGFTRAFRSLAVYERRNSTLYPLLTIDQESIRDENGEVLIDQIPAVHGYGLLLQSFENERLYHKPVTLLEIILLDKNGAGMSDEVIIYWDPSKEKYMATNTFGAP